MQDEQRREMKKDNAFIRQCKKLPSVWRAVSRRVAPFVCLFPPVIVLVAMLVYFRTNKMYPFGDVTISWCDMDQQVVPLLMQLKDCLSGKDGLFLHFKNAGGMNFYGVFFFFLSSPFSLLVAFVERGKVMLFANILVTLKMCAVATTASVYFYYKHKRAFLLNIALSVLYAFSGYVLMYFQNIMWLDIVYLFPLLLLGLDKLKEGKRALFIGVLTACIFVNYYLSYMVVLFLLLYALVWLIVSKDKTFAGNFGVSCLVAMLLSAVVWLPCLIQYFSSGRTTSIYESLSKSSVFTAYETVFPTLFSVLFLFPFALSRKQDNTRDGTLRFTLLLLTLVPFVLEPINKMWQTGNYMSFPTRYGFIPIFLSLSLAYDCMANGFVRKNLQGCSETGDTVERKRKIQRLLPAYIGSVLLLATAILYCVFSIAYTKENHEVMDQYSHSLWGNKASFEALLKLYAVAVLAGVFLYLLWRFSLYKPVLLWLGIAVMTLSELYVAPMTYMHAGSHKVDWHTQVTEMADRIEDEDFYRVKTDKEYSSNDFDVNMMGAIGYNSLGHYTSLTPDNYMTAIKQFGYTSYWMEVGTSGGSILTDALLSVKYSIKRANSDSAVYNGEKYAIEKTPYYLPLGIVTKRDITASQSRSDILQPRAQFQQTLYEDFFGSKDGVSVYGLDKAKLDGVSVTEVDGKYQLKPLRSSASIVFDVPITAKQTLYFNAFDENTNALSQAINEKFSVSAPYYSVSKYPSKKQNGFLCLGEYANRTVSVRIKLNSTVTVRDIGVFGIDNQRLAQDVAKANTVRFTETQNGLSGKYTANEKECVFLSVAYNKGMRCTVNGKKVQLKEVYGGFTAFCVEKGENVISLQFTPVGFPIGLTISLLGLGLCVVAGVFWFKQKWKLQLPKAVNAVAYYGWIAVGVAVVLAIYVVPLVICAL